MIEPTPPLDAPQHPSNALSAPEVVAAFTSAAITALEELTQFPAVAEPPEGEPHTAEQVLATVRLLRQAPGAMTLALAKDAAACLAARYLPSESVLSDELIEDVAGEFANVIAGQAKTMLKGTPFHFALSPPFVVRSSSIAPASAPPPAKQIAAIAFEQGRLLLFVDLPPCPGA